MQLTRTTAAKIEIQRHGKRYGNLKNDNMVSFITYIIWIWVTQKLYLPKIDLSENMFGYFCSGWHIKEEKNVNIVAL